MNEVKLTIIVPVFNVEKYLSHCLKSIITQPFDCGVEILCIDDGSTDNSGKICDDYSRKDSRIKVYHTSNNGVAEARNLGLQMANGKYIAWVDSDDYIAGNWFTLLKEEMNDDVDIIYYDMKIVFPRKTIEKHYKNASCKLINDRFCQELMLGNIPSHLCSKVIKRSLWKNISFDGSLSYCEDYSIMHKLAVKANNITYLHDAIYYYVQRKNSIVNDTGKMFNNLLTGIKLTEIRYKYFLAHGKKVSYIGILLSILTFVWLIDKNKLNLTSKEKKIYICYLRKLQNNIFKIIFDYNVSIKRKIQVLIVCLKILKIIKI